MLQEHGYLGKEDFVFQLRVWAQVRTAFDSLAAINLSTGLSYLFAPLLLGILG